MKLELIQTIHLKRSQSESDKSALVTHQSSEIRPEPDQASQGQTRSTGQIDPQVDPLVDLGPGREFSHPAQFGSVFRISNWFWTVWILNRILKLSEVVTPSYGV